MFQENELISLGYLGSGMAALAGKCKRMLSRRAVTITEIEKYTLQSAKEFLEAVEKGYDKCQLPYKFSNDISASRSYHLYIQARLRMPPLDVPRNSEEIRSEIKELKNTLEDILKGSVVHEGRLERIRLFFSALFAETAERIICQEQEVNKDHPF